MKTTGALLALLTLAPQASASNPFFSNRRTHGAPTWGVRAGLNASTFCFSGDYAHGGTRPGFHVGVWADVPFMESLSFQTGVYYTMKGMKYKEDMQSTLLSYTEEENVRACYVQVPVLAAYHYAISDKAGLQLTAGPYVAVGTNGTWRHRKNGQDIVGENGENLGDADCFGEGFLRRFDAGLQLGAGVTMSRFYAGIAYDWGLANVSRTHRDYLGHKVRMRNGNFSISVGVNF